MKGKRLQFDFTPEQLAKLEELVKHFRAASRAEAVRRAINMSLVIFQEEARGGEIVLRRNGRDEVTLTFVS